MSAPLGIHHGIMQAFHQDRRHGFLRWNLGKGRYRLSPSLSLPSVPSLSVLLLNTVAANNHQATQRPTLVPSHHHHPVKTFHFSMSRSPVPCC